MKLVSYVHGNGASWGYIDGDCVVDLAHIADTLKSAIASKLLIPAGRLVKNQARRRPLDEIRLLPPIPNPTRILCVGQNYVAHREEMQGDTTSRPLIFTRFASSLVGHRQPLLKPSSSDQFDFEGELAIIIGRRGRCIDKIQALDYIAGYSCFMDGSVRDFQNHTTQYIPGKNFDHSGAFGPWMIPASCIPDPNAGLALQKSSGQR